MKNNQPHTYIQFINGPDFSVLYGHFSRVLTVSLAIKLIKDFGVFF